MIPRQHEHRGWSNAGVSADVNIWIDPSKKITLVTMKKLLESMYGRKSVRVERSHLDICISHGFCILVVNQACFSKGDLSRNRKTMENFCSVLNLCFRGVLVVSISSP